MKMVTVSIVYEILSAALIESVTLKPSNCIWLFLLPAFWKYEQKTFWLTLLCWCWMTDMLVVNQLFNINTLNASLISIGGSFSSAGENISIDVCECSSVVCSFFACVLFCDSMLGNRFVRPYKWKIEMSLGFLFMFILQNLANLIGPLIALSVPPANPGTPLFAFFTGFFESMSVAFSLWYGCESTDSDVSVSAPLSNIGMRFSWLVEST